MAKTPSKKKSVDSSQSNTLFSFFKRSDGKSPSEGSQFKQERKAPSDRPPLTHEGISNGSIGDPVVISDDEDDEPLLIPSSSKRRKISPLRRASVRSCSPPPVIVRDVPTKPHPFPNLPDFEAPTTWPEIINTAAEEEDAGFDDNIDGSVVDPMSDDDEAIDEGEQTTVEEPEMRESDDLSTADEIQVTGSKVNIPTESAPFALDPSDDFDPGLVWDEPEDEGMGMEEEGDEEASDIIATPPPRIQRGVNGGKMNECPVCGKSLKGKPNNISQQHINTCLDTPSSSTKTARPITSMAHSFSPAASPSPPPEEMGKGPNAFSVLMSGHKEKEQWKDAEVDLKRDGKRHFGRRKAPFYKVMTGMPVAVDAFRYGAIPKVTAYLLTHAHSDHYTNLSKSWKEGPIYCSETTANLVIHMLGVEPKWVHGLPDNIPFEMPNTGGVKVTPIEANHCPGSSIFLFEGPQTVNAGDSTIKSPYVGSKRTFRYLHCGDFRACPKMVLHPDIARARIDTCYLDTTYLNPKYCFPPQPQVIEACAILARKTALGVSETAPELDDLRPEQKVDTRFDAKPDINAVKEEHEEKSKMLLEGWLAKKEDEEEVADIKEDPDGDVKIEDEGVEGVRREPTDALVEIKPDVKREVKAKPKARTLIVMGTYSIGKERIVKAVAKALGSKIYCDPRKRGILLCQTDPELHSLLTNDPVEGQVHLLPLGNIALDRLQPYLARLHPHFDRVLGFRPTGWSYTPPAGTDMLPDVNMVIRRDQSRTFSHASLKPMRGSCRQFMMYGVPYSEHSSFFELTCFALSVPGPDVRMIATVNVGNEKSRAKMKKWFEKWATEKMKRKERGLPAIVDYRDETYW